MQGRNEIVSKVTGGGGRSAESLHETAVTFLRIHYDISCYCTLSTTDAPYATMCHVVSYHHNMQRSSVV